MALFKCPKCGEVFIENKQMVVCPSCFYEGKLIELNLADFEGGKEKKRFNAKATMDKALKYIEEERKDVFNQPIKFKTSRQAKVQRKLLYLFRQSNIFLWKDLINYSHSNDVRDIHGLGTYYYASLAHLLCETFMIEEVMN